jgi:hypothetical protein
MNGSFLGAIFRCRRLGFYQLNIYLDESGDLGWMFDKPYRGGGSSRYLVIAAIIIPDELDKHPERVMKGLANRYQWKNKREKKWHELSDMQKLSFAKSAHAMLKNNTSIQAKAIVVNKTNVQDHLRRDSNLLYNYMTKLLLIDEMAKHPRIRFVPDPRSIKVKSGSSLVDYLQTTLFFEKKVTTRICCEEIDSAHCRNLQFTDMLAGTVGSLYEKSDPTPLKNIGSFIDIKRLFF